MDYFTPLSLVIFSLAIQLTLGRCPSSCICVIDQINCPPNSLSEIPNDLDENITSLTLSQNQFSNPTLTPLNFTRLSRLSSLFLKQCGIKSIQSGTFSRLTQLRLLDLSQNGLQDIEPRAFAGLQLEYLFLTDNTKLRDLPPTTLVDMTTQVLDLRNCGLSDIRPTLFTPMIGSLRKLFLQGNKFLRFSPGMLGVFATLETIRIHNNPLSCDCTMLWLKDFYDINTDVFKDSARKLEEPLCASVPLSSSNQYFSNLLPTDFICVRPTINTTVYINGTVSVLKCEASGYPPPSVTWFLPNKSNEVYPAHQSRETTIGELKVYSSNVNNRGLYKCLATNEAGITKFSLNVTLDDLTPCAGVLPTTTTTGAEVVVPANQPPNQAGDEKRGLLKQKYFSLLDLICSVLGTFIGTLVVVVVTLHFCVYRRKTASSSQYSNSSSPMSDYCMSLHNGAAYPTHGSHQIMLQNGTCPQCIQNRPLPNKPYTRVYDDTHYMSSPLSEREEFEKSNTISPYGLLNAAGSISPQASSSTTLPCEGCRSRDTGR